MPSGPPLITLDRFADFLQVESADLERGGDDLLAAASNLIRNRGLDQRIDLVEDDVAEFYGDGSAVIFLPELPVHDVTAVTVDDVALEAGTDFRAELGREGRRAILRRLGGRTWARGEVIAVTYTHGWRLTPAGSGDFDAPTLPEDLALIVCRVAARGIANPLSLVQQSMGRVVQQFGFDASRVATLTDADLADLAAYQRGGAGGSR